MCNHQVQVSANYDTNTGDFLTVEKFFLYLHLIMSVSASILTLNTTMVAFCIF